MRVTTINLMIKLLVALVWLLLSGIASAQVYKWVDENGKVHFSDEPPKNQQADAEVMDVKRSNSAGSTDFPSLSRLEPIQPEIGAAVKSVMLENVAFEIGGVKIGESRVIGKAYKYTREARRKVSQYYKGTTPKSVLPCLPDGDLDLKNANYILKKSRFAQPFNRAFQENGYVTNGMQKKRFALQESSNADLSLAAVVTDIKLAYCGPANSSSLGGYTQNSSYLKITWGVFDNLTRRVVFSTESEGVDIGLQSAPRENGTTLSVGLAFLNAVERLLAQQAFVDVVVSRQGDEPRTSKQSSSQKAVTVAYGDTGSTFLKRIEKIKRATATIRTSSGHGSGFVVSREGYVVTNAHVVGSSKMVLVLIDGQEIYAHVMESDAGRDVALLKLDIDQSVPYLRLEAENASLGETIYIVGTPLDERLDFSISRGIVSASRLMEGRNFYQTDAAVNPGNSGGPVFNEYGNVIGITVAGHFTRDGGSKNISYIIPIHDALTKLGIKKAR